MNDPKTTAVGDDRKQYRGNLAGFIVQGLVALLHLLAAATAVYHWSTYQATADKEHQCGLSGFLFSSMHKFFAADPAKEKGMTVYLVACALLPLASAMYCVWGMAVRRVFWHQFAYLFNAPLYACIIMTAFSWYMQQATSNWIAWLWTLLLLLSMGHEVMLVMARFVSPAHAYLLPWVKADAVPKLVI